MKKISSGFIILFVIYIIFSVFPLSSVFTGSTYKGNTKQSLDNLDMNIKLNSDGSMNIRELWKVNLEDRDENYRNIYKTFTLDSDKAGNIENFKVYDVDYNKEYTTDNNILNPSTNKNTGKKDISYMYKNGNSLEMGFYMPEISSGLRTFELSYTINDIISVYNDTAVLYYQEVASKFSLPIKDMTCKISMPENLSQTPLRAWLHCTASSNLTIDSQSQVSFTANKIPANTLVETRLCMPISLYSESTRKINSENLQNVINEETRWEEEYKQKMWQQYILGIVDIALGLLLVIGAIVYFIYKSIKNKKFKPNIPEYVRYIPPDETPGTMAEIFYYYKNSLDKKNASNINKKTFGKVFSATILNLAHKKCISLEPRAEGKDFNIKILKNDTAVNNLSQSELTFFTLLSNLGKHHSEGLFSMDDFETYAKTHYKYVNNTLDAFLSQIHNECSARNYFVKSKKFSVLGIIAIAVIFLSIFFILKSGIMIYLPLGAIIASIIILTVVFMKPKLSLEGETKFCEWKGLKKFMLEFSNMKEYSTFHLSLWEEYLVYATAMGISKKVCEQLKIAYSRLNQAEIDNNMTDSFLYWTILNRPYYGYRGDMFDFGVSLSNRLDTIYNSANRLANPPANSSSGSSGGFGGSGFGGGGGGFGGGGGGVR